MSILDIMKKVLGTTLEHRTAIIPRTQIIAVPDFEHKEQGGSYSSSGVAAATLFRRHYSSALPFSLSLAAAA